MLKQEKIEIFISYRNITHYRKLGYSPEINKNLIININDLPTSSHVIVTSLCVLCKAEKDIR
jgi:hypothetical protein